jgi:hypothetical protein
LIGNAFWVKLPEGDRAKYNWKKGLEEQIPKTMIQFGKID